MGDLIPRRSIVYALEQGTVLCVKEDAYPLHLFTPY